MRVFPTCRTGVYFETSHSPAVKIYPPRACGRALVCTPDIMFSVEIVIAILFSIVQLSLSGSVTQSTHSLRKENQQ